MEDQIKEKDHLNFSFTIEQGETGLEIRSDGVSVNGNRQDLCIAICQVLQQPHLEPFAELFEDALEMRRRLASPAPVVVEAKPEEADKY